MDSYFKAAVSDLDKLLDELEQNTDELEDSSLVNQVDSKHHLLSSDLDHQQPKFLEPNVQEHTSGCTMVDELSLSTRNTNASPLEQMNSEQNEKNVAGLDLLSMVDSGSSDENQSLCLGRCSIPVCDLISDTGNLSHVKSNSECVQKLQLGNSQCSMNSLIGFDLALLPATACNLSAHCNTNSGTQQKMDGDTVLYNVEYSATEEQSQLALKMGSLAESNVVNLSSNQEKTATLNNNEVSDLIEPSVDPDRISVLMPLIPNVHSSKDDTICEKLSCEPLVDENAHCESQIIDGENGTQAISKEDSIESLAIHLPKTYELNKNSVSDDLPQTADMQVLDKIHSTEKNLHSLEQNTNTNVNIVSTPEVTEDTHTSLSCLPLAVSICRSLVTTEETHGNISQNEALDVISDLTMHTDQHNPGLPKRELHENAEDSEQEENQTNQCLEKPFTDKEKVDLDNIASKCELLQHQDTTAIFSGSSEADIETCSRILPTDPGARISVSSAVEEELSSDILISDAELDAFLSEHCLEASDSKPLKEDTDDGLLESDVIRDANKVNVQSDGSQAETEFKMEASVDKLSCVVPNSEPKLRILVEKSTQQAHQETSDHISGTQSEFSDLINSQHVVHSGGARPKQLPNLPPKAKICSELKSPNTHGSEPQVNNSMTPNTSRLNAKICPDSSLGYNYADTQSCLKGKGESELAEPSKVIVLGQKQPSWVPDSEAPQCMNCQAKFTFTKRRHHCRACGKVFCAPCCNRKCKLQYLDKEARVCVSCYESINKAQAFERMMSPTGPGPDSDVSEYCSAVPPLPEAQTSGTPNSPVSFPSSVFKQPNGDGLCTKEQRRVWFADGILPNGEVADTTKLSSGVRRSPQESYPAETPSDTTGTTDVKPKDEIHFGGQTETLNFPASILPEEDALPTKGQLELLCNFDTTSLADDKFSGVVEPTKLPDPAVANETNDVPSDVSTVDDYGMLCGIEKYVGKDISFIPEDDGLPPLLVLRGEKGEESLVEEHPSHKQITLMLESNTLTFVLNANLLVNVKILSYCSERCWYYSTNGLHGLGQAEIIILLLCLPDEEEIPKEIFKLFIDIYKDAMKGKFIGNLENITFTESFLGSKEHGGFLFVTPTFQKLDDLTLPQTPYLCGILIQKQEVPWAKVFPIRLVLRLGAEYAAYPTPLTSIRHRKPLFGEIGHTVMNLLVDLRNYQYTLHTVGNLFIHMEMGRSCIKVPLRKYNEVMKVVNTSNEHVISIGASFSPEADSHLVCVQNDDGVYQTQANSATGHPRKITGASFVVFNGALKTSSGFLAKSSIVEDGIMVQITPETMDGLRQALREKKNFRITCGKVDSGDLREYVDICWEENEEKTNVGVRSPIDGKSMEGVESEKIVQEHQFEMDEKLVKCTEVFYLLKPSDVYGHSPYEFAKDIALASCAAFRHHLKTLKSNGMNKIGLRVSVDTDMVEYQAGSGGQLLPQHYLNDLDSALIPVIHGGTSDATNLPLEMELVFFITESLLM